MTDNSTNELNFSNNAGSEAEPIENDYFPWSSQEEKDLDIEIMNECHQAEMHYAENCLRITNRILTVLKRVKGDQWYSELIEYSNEAEAHNPFIIVRSPVGQWQEESEYELLGGVWVDQSSSYPCEDCYYGTVTVKIDDKRWLEMPFNC
jgi:hypothetical protein